jgi:argininosuccinate lyase
VWEAIGRGLTAHIVMLRDTAIIDDPSAAAALTAIDGVRRGDPLPTVDSLALVAAFDDRVDSLSPAGASGIGRIARARHDLAVTAQRLVLRDRLLALLAAQQVARGALLDLAESHVFTLLPVWAESAALQPTNFAHFLTGTIAPLGRSARQLHAVYAEVARSPLGAGALAGPGLPVDREETADLLGDEGPIESTFDAVAAVDHLVFAGDAAAAAAAPWRRLLSEFLLWLRADPDAIRLADELRAPPDANLPHFRPPIVLARLVATAGAVADDAAAIARSVAAVPYGPAGDAADRAVVAAAAALADAASVSEASATLVSGPIEFNRAWLARHAGRALVTSGDLADFLMAEEGLDPGSARSIAALTANRALQEGLEASAITPQMIDSAALVTIGRELGIELERLGAYLAPRRFIEKRTVLGGPAPATVREYLATARAALAADQTWLEEKQRRIALADENLEIRTREVLEAGTG